MENLLLTVNARLRVPTACLDAWLRHWPNADTGILAATASVRRELAARGMRNTLPRTRCVNTTRFRPRDRSLLPNLERPI